MTPEDYKKIISMAINREVEAYTFYKTVSDKVKDANLKRLFTELAGEETKHREFLQGLLAKDVKALKFSPAKDFKVGDNIKTPDLSPDMKPVDGLVVAIKKELEAMQMYTALANNSEDPEQKKMFLELANMERGHKARLEDIYVNTAFAESW
ncbi:MAG: ferritin family protein [Methanolinea sp.]|nr:ferritin family protein [Methanolinea sp.]